MPLPRHGIAAVTLDDAILLPAGGTIQGLGPTVRVDRFVPRSIPGDANGDGVVDLRDLLLILANWGPCDPPPPAECPGDVDENGTVDTADILLVLANWE